MTIDNILDKNTDMLKELVGTSLLKKSLNHEEQTMQTLIEGMKIPGIGENIDIQA